MKKLITCAFMAVCMIASCNKFDDSAIWDKLNKHESRITYLEEVCKKMNADILNLQTIVTALETNDYIVNSSPLTSGDGYTFIFKSGKSVVIYNGKNGSDGIDGKDGKDGVTPTISVLKDVDGVYYWTVNNEWLLVNGEKVQAAASDGKDGVDGKNGVTPSLKIEDDYWYVSYDNGKLWEKLGKATGSNGIDGINGVDGDSIFRGITLHDGYVVFILNDGNGTRIKLPFQSESSLTISISENQPIELVLSPAQLRNTLYLKVVGEFKTEDLNYILARMLVLETLDLSEAAPISTYFRTYNLNPWKETYLNNTIREVDLSPYVEVWDIDYMLGLETIRVYPGFKEIGVVGASVEYLPYLKNVHFTEGISSIGSCPINFRKTVNIVFPSTLTEVSEYVFYENNAYTGGFRAESVTIYAITPPQIINDGSGFYTTKNDRGDITAPLYVPKQSIDLYKNAKGWEQFKNIYPIDSASN